MVDTLKQVVRKLRWFQAKSPTAITKSSIYNATFLKAY